MTLRLPLAQIFAAHGKDYEVIEYVGTFTHENPTYNSRGIYQENEKESGRTMVNLVLRPLGNEATKFGENGTYLASDKKIYSRTELKPQFQKIVVGEELYRVMEEVNNDYHGEYFIYIAKSEVSL